MTEWTPEIPEGDQPAYLAIAEAIIRDVAEGTLRPGDRLPPQRELARRLKVSLGTVTRAYIEAGQRGVLSGKVGRGTFIRDPNLDLDPYSHHRPGTGPGEVVDMGIAMSIEAGAPDLGEVLSSLSKRSDVSQLLSYRALNRARFFEAGAEWLRSFGADLDPTSVVITAGAHHALTVILSVMTNPGDVVLSEEPTMPGFMSMSQQQSLRLHGVPMDGEGIIPEALEDLCRQKKPRLLFIVPTIQNPTTVQLPLERREAIAAMAEKHDFYVIEDDAFRLLEPKAPPPVRTLIPDRTFFVATTSKAIGGGLRVAFMAAPRFAIESLRHAVWTSVVAPPPLSLEIVSTWIADGTAARHAESNRLEAEARQRIAKGILGDAQYSTRPASLFVWLTLPPALPDVAFADALRQLGVIVTPSREFTVESDASLNAIRICLGTAKDQIQMRAGLERIAEMLAPRERTFQPVV